MIIIYYYYYYHLLLFDITSKFIPPSIKHWGASPRLVCLCKLLGVFLMSSPKELNTKKLLN